MKQFTGPLLALAVFFYQVLPGVAQDSGASITSKPAGSLAVTVTPSTLTMNLSYDVQANLRVAVYPATPDNKKGVTWKTSDASVVSIASPTGNTGPQDNLLTAHGVGTAIITATAVSAGQTDFASCRVTVTELGLSQYALGVRQGCEPATIGAKGPGPVVWSSSDPTVASVNNRGQVTFKAPGKAVLTAKSGGASAVCPVVVRPEDRNWPTKVDQSATVNTRVGFNLWDIGWAGYDLYYQSGLRGKVPAWTPDLDPWKPQFLTDTAQFTGPIRFMDPSWPNGPWVNWSDRLLPSKDQTREYSYDVAPPLRRYYDNNAKLSETFMAYEWMADLCNRTGHDLWVCVPMASTPDYWTKLAQLFRYGSNASGIPYTSPQAKPYWKPLNPSLRVFVEYGNEYWNGIMKGFYYTIDQGTAWRGSPLTYTKNKKLAGQPYLTDDYNIGSAKPQWYEGSAWAVYQNLLIAGAFQDVYGAPNMGLNKQVVRVYSTSGNFDLGYQAIKKVVYDGTSDSADGGKLNPTRNPRGQVFDLMAIAPYIGPDDNATNKGTQIDPAGPDIAQIFRNQVDWSFAHYILPAQKFATKWGMPLGCYEGGQQLGEGTEGYFNKNPAVYAEFQYYLDQLNAAHLVVFPYYTIYSGTWGLKTIPEETGLSSQDPGHKVSPKYEAVVDWVEAHP